MRQKLDNLAQIKTRFIEEDARFFFEEVAAAHREVSIIDLVLDAFFEVFWDPGRFLQKQAIRSHLLKELPHQFVANTRRALKVLPLRVPGEHAQANLGANIVCSQVCQNMTVVVINF